MLINVQFSQRNVQLNTKFSSNDMRLAADFADFQKVTILDNVDPYMGDYEITPKVEAQTMPTAQKLMTKDVTIKAIPYFDVSNSSGGSTVYIAKEV